MDMSGQLYPFEEPTGPNGYSEWVTEQIWTQQGEIKCLLPNHETPSHYIDATKCTK